MKIFRSSICVLVSFLLTANYSLNNGQSGSQTSAGNQDAGSIYKGKEVDQKPQVKKKPKPSYTRDARKHGVAGTVVIRCVFAATGQVTNIHVISGLPEGLTERAVEAARKVKFIPAMKDGHPVSMWMQLEYNFNLY
jgi:TonB family protein